MSVRVRAWKRGGFKVSIYFRWTDRTAYRERRVLDVRTEAAARRWGEARESLVRQEGQSVVEAAKPSGLSVPTLREFAPRFVKEYAIADGHGEGGVESKESILRLHLVPHLGHKRLDQITNADVQKLKGIWRQGIADPKTGRILVKPTSRIKTLNNRLTVLGRLLRIAVEWHDSTHLEQMPCEVRLLRGDDSEEQGFYDHDTYDALVDAAGRCGTDVALVVLLGGEAGLRRGEMIGVQPGDVVAGKLHVQRQVYSARVNGTRERAPVVTPTKGKRKRWIPLTPRLAQAIANHRHLRGPWLLCQPDGSPLTPKLIDLLMQRAERRAGMQPTGRVHILRHSFCSHLAMAGASPVTIQNLAGHKSLETTMKYMHLSPSAVDDAIAKLVHGREEQRRRGAGPAPTQP